MRYIDLSIQDYAGKVASKPMPGGGSIAALSGALAVSLLMKASIISRKKISKQMPRLKDRFLELIDEDVSKFKAGPKEAVSTLLEICQMTSSALRIAVQILESAKPVLKGDIWMAQGLLIAAFDSARLNIEINLKSVKDKKFVTKIKKTIKTLFRGFTIRENPR